MSKGWYRENYRHSLAARGIRTSFQSYKIDSYDWARKRDNEYEKLIYDFWNANIKGTQFNYPGGFEKLTPFLKKKLAEHGLLTKSDFIEAQMDYIARRRHNFLYPDKPISMVSTGGSFPVYFGGEEPYQGYSKKRQLLKSSKMIPAYLGTSVMPGKPGIWAEDFRTVRRKYLNTLGLNGVATLLAEGTLAGKVNTERKPNIEDFDNEWAAMNDLTNQYREELKSRPLQEDELNYIWDEVYEKNKEAHEGMSEFHGLSSLYERLNQIKEEGYVDKAKNSNLFDSLIHAQHFTGSLLPIDVEELRAGFDRKMEEKFEAENKLIMEERARSIAGKKPVKLLYGEYDKAVAAGKNPIISKIQLKKGIKIEMEHTSKKWLAEKIAKDHITEFPRYYTALEEMERKLE